MADYTPKALTTKISASSSVTIKIRDNYYKVEFSEEREIPDFCDEGKLDVEKERQALFDAVNAVVDAQAEDILRTFQKK